MLPSTKGSDSVVTCDRCAVFFISCALFDPCDVKHEAGVCWILCSVDLFPFSALTVVTHLQSCNGDHCETAYGFFSDFALVITWAD